MAIRLKKFDKGIFSLKSSLLQNSSISNLQSYSLSDVTLFISSTLLSVYISFYTIAYSLCVQVEDIFFYFFYTFLLIDYYYISIIVVRSNVMETCLYNTIIDFYLHLSDLFNSVCIDFLFFTTSVFLQFCYYAELFYFMNFTLTAYVDIISLLYIYYKFLLFNISEFVIFIEQSYDSINFGSVISTYYFFDVLLLTFTIITYDIINFFLLRLGIVTIYANGLLSYTAETMLNLSLYYICGLGVNTTAYYNSVIDLYDNTYFSIYLDDMVNNNPLSYVLSSTFDSTLDINNNLLMPWGNYYMYSTNTQFYFSSLYDFTLLDTQLGYFNLTPNNSLNYNSAYVNTDLLYLMSIYDFALIGYYNLLSLCMDFENLLGMSVSRFTLSDTQYFCILILLLQYETYTNFMV